MKKIIAVSLILLSTNITYSKEEKTESDKKIDDLIEQVAVLNSKMLQFKDSLEKKNLYTKELIDKHKWKNEVLEQRIQQASDTIANQNSLFDGFGILYAIITIVMTLIAIGLPIVTYQFGVKPSKNALKELENNLDNKVEIYLKKSRSNQVKKSIKHLKGDNDELKGQAISFLSLTQHEGFSDEEMFEFYQLIESNKLTETYVGSVAHLLSSRVNDFANKIFSNKEQLKNNSIKSSAYQYIPKAGLSKFIKPLTVFLRDNNNQYGEFWTLVTFTHMYSKSVCNELFESKELIDILNPETLLTLKIGLKPLLENLNIDEEIFNKTYLFRKIETAAP
ncbi:MAG TPA: hypothetical protein VL021_05380 [Brumimicrobium sp.]|nr:hypothetical protein [Brumimicrobium sp.]